MKAYSWWDYLKYAQMPYAVYADAELQNQADATALYRLLEEEIVPAFYDRGADQVPDRWMELVKEAIRTVAPRFSARRMVKDYVEQAYAKAVRTGTPI